MALPNIKTNSRRFAQLSLVLLAIECLDELAFGAREAAWPLIRTDLHLSYIQIGILLTIPGIWANLIEPFLSILSDFRDRRPLIWVGGIAFALALLLAGSSASFLPMLLAMLILYPASGAFVSLSQATLMDLAPDRHESSMARWTLAGSIGVVVGPLLLNLALFMGGNWRWIFLALAGVTVILVIATRHLPRTGSNDTSLQESLAQGFRNVWQALRRRDVVRWLVLLECSDLMLDILLGFLALYFVDTAGVTPEQAALAVAVWSTVGLLGDFALVPLIERVPGLTYLRYSAVIELILYMGFLLWPGFIGKLIILGLLGFFNSGWYSILKAQLYSAMPGQSGASIAVNNFSGLIGSLIPLGLSLVAQTWGLSTAMYLLLLGPIALLIGLPRKEK